MNLLELKTNIALVGYICTHRVSFQFTIQEIHEMVRVLEYELSLQIPMYVSGTSDAKSWWESYQVINKRYEKLYLSGKRKGSINLKMANWNTLYCLFMHTQLDSMALRQVLDQLHQFIISYSHKGIINQ